MKERPSRWTTSQDLMVNLKLVEEVWGCGEGSGEDESACLRGKQLLSDMYRS